MLWSYSVTDRKSESVPRGPAVQKVWVPSPAPLPAGSGSQRSAGATATARLAWLVFGVSEQGRGGVQLLFPETLNPFKHSAIFLLSQLARL